MGEGSPVPPPPAKQGSVVEHGVSGFPVNFTKKGLPTVITSDVWAYLEYVSHRELPQDQARAAVAYVDQAYEFFEAASNPNVSSRPLLYYYSFLNLAKVLLLHRRVKFLPLVHHGLHDPKTNLRSRLRFTNQIVNVEGIDVKGANLFPRFAKALGRQVNPTQYRVVDLLRQVPGIHRTFCAVTDSQPSFCPIANMDVFKSRSEYWVRVRLEAADPDVKATIGRVRRSRGFQRVFHRVISGNEGESWFETDPRVGPRKAVTTALRSLRDQLLDCGVWTILTSKGPRRYFGAFPPSARLPQLAAVYAVMFYLGSITRYKPYDFDRIVKKGYSWLVSEFLETQPAQFVYGLAGQVAGADVVVPFSAVPAG